MIVATILKIFCFFPLPICNYLLAWYLIYPFLMYSNLNFFALWFQRRSIDEVLSLRAILYLSIIRISKYQEIWFGHS